MVQLFFSEKNCSFINCMIVVFSWVANVFVEFVKKSAGCKIENVAWWLRWDFYLNQLTVEQIYKYTITEIFLLKTKTGSFQNTIEAENKLDG